MRRGGAGFTFIEIMLVVVILMLLGAVAMPRMRSTMEEIRLKRAARDVSALLRLARDSAVVRGKPVQIIFSMEDDHNRYQMALLDEYFERVELPRRRGRGRWSDTSQYSIPGVESLRVRTLPDGVFFAQISSAAPLTVGAGRPRVIFYPDGSASAATVGLQDGRDRTLSVELYRSTGLARVEPGLAPIQMRTRSLVLRGGRRGS